MKNFYKDAKSSLPQFRFFPEFLLWEEERKKKKEKKERKRKVSDGTCIEQELRLFFLANKLSVAGAFASSLKGQWGGKKRLRSSR